MPHDRRRSNGLDFELSADDGRPLRLFRMKGRPSAIQFYPKDDTSGCTAEARARTCLVDAFGEGNSRRSTNLP